jgi:hypothetical protein
MHHLCMAFLYLGFWYQLLVMYHTIHGNSLRSNFDSANFQQKHTQNSLVLHQIDSGLSYFAFYMHRVSIYGLLIMTLGVDGTGNGSSLHPSCGVVFQNDLTLICLVLQQIDCSFSYCAFPMHGIGISVLLIMNWWCWWFKLHGFLFCHGECSH